MQMNACEKLEDNLKCHSSGTTHLLSEIESLTGLELTRQFSLAGQ